MPSKCMRYDGCRTHRTPIRVAILLQHLVTRTIGLHTGKLPWSLRHALLSGDGKWQQSHHQGY